MAHGRIAADWDRTSYLAAVLVNINRAKGKRPVKPREMNPYAEQQASKSEPDFYITPSQLAQIFTSHGVKRS